MNIFEPGDTVFILAFMNDHSPAGLNNILMQTLHNLMPQCAVSVTPVWGTEPQRVEVLGVYRPPKTCLCED